MKAVSNNKIIYNNVYGRVAQHELFLDQSVRNDSSPTFANLTLTSNCTINGNLYVYGNTSIFDTNVIEFEDNIIEINSLETGNGVTLNQAGIEINRGSKDPYRIVFDESSGTTKVGPVNNLKNVLSIRANQLDHGIITWEELGAECISTDSISIPITFNNTQNSTCATTGSVVVNGGIGVSKNICVNGDLIFRDNYTTVSNAIYNDTDGSLILDSCNTNIPEAHALSFGNKNQSIMENDGKLCINYSSVSTGSDTIFYGNVMSKYRLYLSESSSQRALLYSSESSGIMSINIDTDRVVMPSDTRMIFGDYAQRIQTDINGDLLLYSGSDIILNSRNVYLQYNSGLFTGINNKIYSDPSENMYIVSLDGVHFDTDNVHFSAGSNVYFGDVSCLRGDSSGNIELPTASSIIVNGTLNVNTPIHVHNGLCISNSNESILNFLESNTNGSLIVRNSCGSVIDINGPNITFIGTVSANQVSCDSIDVSNGVNDIKTTQGILINTYNTRFSNTQESTDMSSGSIIIDGGIAVNKTLRASSASLYGCDMNFNKITSVADPSNDYDAVNKRYVDVMKLGLEIKDSVRVATITDGNISTDFISGMTIDSVVVTSGDRILIKDQLLNTNNGIYIVQTAGNPIRTYDFFTGTHGSSNFVFVREGCINKNMGFICTTLPPNDIIGTNGLNFTEFVGLGQIEAGDGLGKTNNTIFVNTDNYSIEVNNDNIRVSKDFIGTGLTGGSGIPLSTLSDQSHVTRVGTLNTGTWQANVIGCDYGGTGSDLTKYTSGYLLSYIGDQLNTSASKFISSNVWCSNGNVGIGTTSPSGNLEVCSNTGNHCNVAFGFNNNSLSFNVNSSSSNISSDRPVYFQGSTFGNANISVESLISNTLIANNGINVSGGCSVISGMTVDSLTVSQGSFITDIISSNIVINDTLVVNCSSSNYTISGSNGSLGINLNGSTNSVLLDSTGSFMVSQDATFLSQSIFSNTADAFMIGDPASVVIEGGSVIKKNTIIGGNTCLIGDTFCLSDFVYNGNGFFQNISNTSGNAQWWYLGQVQSSCMYIYETINGGQSTCLELFIHNDAITHSYSNSGSTRYINANVYSNSINTKFLFLLLQKNSVVQIHNTGSLTAMNALCEGTASVPNGQYSLFDGDYTLIYSALSEGTVSKSIGDTTMTSLINTGRWLTVNGNGEKNYNSGLLIQRYQIDNDTNYGDVIRDTPSESLVIGSVSGINNLQIRLGTAGSTVNDYYIGWWLKITSGSGINQSRQITNYDGTQKIVSFRTPLSTLPAEGDSISLFSRTMCGMYYNETSGTLDFSYIPTTYDIPIVTHGNLLLRAGQFTSLNETGESLRSYGDATIYSSSGSSLVVHGTAQLRDVNISDSVFINGTAENNINVICSSPSILLSNGINNFTIRSNRDALELTDSSTSSLSLHDGCVSINTFATSNNTILIPAEGSIGCDTTSSFIKIGNNSSSSFINLYGDDSTVNSTAVINSSGGYIALNKDGTTNISSNVISGSSSASLLCSGGITVLNTTNSINVSNGGALTVLGGGSVLKDLYIGGSLHVSESIMYNNIFYPTIGSLSATNCSILSFDNVTLMKFNDERLLSFNVSIIPTSGSTLCEFDFEIPELTNNFTSRKNVIININGYEVSGIIPLFNVVSVAAVGSKTCIVKFQSVNTGTHDFNVMCRYTNAF